MRVLESLQSGGTGAPGGQPASALRRPGTTSAMMAALSAEGFATVAAPFADALTALARTDERVIALTGERGAAHGDLGAFARAFPDRLMQMGPADQVLIAAASGLAREGFIPFATTYAASACRRAYDIVATTAIEPPRPLKLMGLLPGLASGADFLCGLFYDLLHLWMTGIAQISHRSGQIRRPDKHTIHTLDRSDLRYLPHCLHSFDLNQDTDLIIGILGIVLNATIRTGAMHPADTANTVRGIATGTHRALRLFRCLDKGQQHRLRTDIQNHSHTGRNASQKPNMRTRDSKLNMSHSLAPNRRTCYLNSAPVAYYAFVANLTVFSAIAFVVLFRTKDALVKKSVFFRPLRSVIDSFGLSNLPKRPR